MLAFQVENNESQMLGIKKKEYLRVLSDIVKESQLQQVKLCGTMNWRFAWLFPLI